MSVCAFGTGLGGNQMSDRLGGPVVSLRAADLLFAAVFLVVATVVVFVALLHI